MNQLILNFKHFRVSEWSVRMLELANSATYYEKKFRFYPFKTRFLRAHAIPDGYDLQILTLKCHCGDGIFRGVEHTRPERFFEVCHKCGGSGIYLVKKILLTRWLIRGRLFHEPSTLVQWREGMHINETFTGFITHAPVDPKRGRRAMMLLLLRHEPRTFMRIIKSNSRDRCYRPWYLFKWKWHAFLRFIRHEKPDDVPF